MSTQQDNAQDHNIPAPEPPPQDPTNLAQRPAEPVTIGPVTPGHRTPGSEDPEDAPTEVDPHEVRTRPAVHGTVHGLELDGGAGVVFIPQHALPDLRRRLYLAQQRFTALSGPVPGKRRRRPTSAA